MDSRYSYDENQEVWPFFAATVLGCILTPLTVSNLLSAGGSNRGVILPSKYPSVLKKYDATHQKRKLLSKRAVFLVAGWLVMAYLVQVIRNADPSENKEAFDPWNLLGIARAATEKEIKSAYRELSKKFHPDKIRDFGEFTKEQVEERYVQITKAYKALTDEVTRENFLKYGHPDGPQAQVLGIALPKFLVEGGSAIVVLFYLAVGVTIPLSLSRWWSAQTLKNKNGLLQSTASQFFQLCSQQQPMFISCQDVIDTVVECEDYDDSLTPAQRLQLIKDHLERKPASDAELLQRTRVVATTVKLVEGLSYISSEFKVFDFNRRLAELQRCLVQAVPLDKQSKGALLQLDIDSKDPKVVEKVLKTAPIPRISVLKAFFKVPGQDDVTPGTLPHLVIKYVVAPPGASRKPDIDEEALTDNSEYDFNGHQNLRVVTNPLITNNQYPKLGPVHSSHYPVSEGFIPKWNAFIYGDRDHMIVSQPVSLDHVDLSNMALSPEQFAAGEGVVVGTFKIMLSRPVPPQLGKVNFKLALLNTGYFGVDIYDRVSVDIKAPKPLAQEEEEEIEEKEDEIDESDLSDIDTDTEAED